MGKQWLSRCEKRWRISCMWEILFFLFTYVLYNADWPLLYSLTNIVPLKHTKLDFNLPITISDFCGSIKQTQHTHAHRHTRLFRIIFPKFSEHTYPFTNPFSPSFLEFPVSWGLCGREEFWVFSSAQPRVRVYILGTEVKRKPSTHQQCK